MMRKVLIGGCAVAGMIALTAAVSLKVKNSWQVGHRESRREVVVVSTRTPALTTSSCGSPLTRFTFQGIVSATLPKAGGSFAVCQMSFLNSTSYTVTVTPKDSKFNGGNVPLTLLPTDSAQVWSDGTNWWGRYDRTYTQDQTTVQRGDTVTGPSSPTSFASTVTLPANLPRGTQIRIFADAWVKTITRGSPTLRVGTVQNDGRGNLWLCAGDVFANFKGGHGAGGSVDYWLDCNFVVRTAGTRGTVEGMTDAAAWMGDCTFNHSCFGDTGNNGGSAQYPGSFFPGYDADSVQYLGYAAGDKTLDTTRSHTLYATTGNDPKDTYVLRGFTIFVVIP